MALTWWLSNFISLSVERQEAEPASVKKHGRRRRLRADSGGVERKSWILMTCSKRRLRQRANYRGEKTLVFLMITDGTGKCQQTPELNKDQSRSTIGFLCSASCLKLFFIAVQIGEKDLVFCFCAFFRYMWGVCAFFFFLFFFKVLFLIFFFFLFFLNFFIFYFYF